jgi:hypothetical protein
MMYIPMATYTPFDKSLAQHPCNLFIETITPTQANIIDCIHSSIDASNSKTYVGSSSTGKKNKTT